MQTSQPRKLYLIFFPLFLTMSMLGSITPCEAGSISITTKASARMESGALLVALQITNKGDEKAYYVRADAEAVGGRFETTVQPALGPGESKAFEFNMAVQVSKNGSYPMTVLVHFQDGNGYPFSALTCTTFLLGEEVNPDLSSSAAPSTLKDQGLLCFKIQNRGPRQKNVRAALHLPREFSSERSMLDLLLLPGDRKDLCFSIRNLSGFYRATYPVFLAQEYDDGGTHFAVVTTAVVSIVGEGNWFKRTRWYWAGGMMLLIGFLAFLAVKSRITRILLTF